MIEKIFSIFKEKKGLFILIIGAVIGIILIFADSTPKKQIEQNGDSLLQIKQYTQELEERLEKIISTISGVSDVRVLITLESGSELIYASDDSENTEKHVVVNNGLVLVKENLPKIKGVAVVCKGGNNAELKTKITELTCSVLGLYSTRVYVTE